MRIYQFVISLMLFLGTVATLSLSVSGQAMAQEAQGISLVEALELAHKNSKSDAQLEIQSEIAEVKVKEVKAKWWPQITADAKAVVWNDNSMLQVIDKENLDLEASLGQAVQQGMAGMDTAQQMAMTTMLGMMKPLVPPVTQALMDIIPSELELREQFTAIVGVQLVMPLTPLLQVYQGQKLAELGVKDVEIQRKGQSLAIDFEVTDVYLKLVYAQLMVDVAQEALDTIQKHVEMAQKYENAGMISHNDVLSAEVELVKARQDLMEARQGKRLAGMKLVQTLGLPRGTEVSASDMPQETFSVALAPLSDYQTRALEQRTELERLSLTQELGERSAKLAIYDYIPKVALVARYEFAHGTAMQPTNQAFIGLAANWTIFDGLEKHYAAKRAELEASQNATKAEEAEEVIALEVIQKYLNLETALEKTALTKQALALADENLRMITAQFAQGESVNTDVLTAQTKRAAARASDVKARIDVLSALAALYLSLGEEPRLTQDAIR